MNTVNIPFHELRDDWPGTAAQTLPLVVRIEGEKWLLHDLPFRHRDFLALYIVQCGQGVHVINERRYAIARGDVYIMGQGVTHFYENDENLKLIGIYFSPRIFSRAALDSLRETSGFLPLFVEQPLGRAGKGREGGRWLHLTPEHYAHTAVLVTELHEEWMSGSLTGAYLARILFMRLLIHLSRQYAQTHLADVPEITPAKGDDTIAAAVRFLDEHFAEPIRIEQVAASIFLSPDRFTEVFAAALGRTPRNYLSHLRLECAKTLLAETTLPVTDIGRQSGLGEPAYFARMFRAATGLSPSQYRNKYRSLLLRSPASANTLTDFSF